MDPAALALLHHLEACGFEGAPRVLGFDAHGREILEYISGRVPWPAQHHELLGTDEAMHRSGRLLREFHDAVRTFVPPPGAPWRSPERADDSARWVDHRGTIICHNDATAWNLVIGDDRWAFIDWDFAGPRPFIWDVAYALIGLIPLGDDLTAQGWAEPPPVIRRILAFTDGYGLETVDRQRVVPALLTRIESSYTHLQRNASAGTEPWLTLWNEGHGDGWSGLLAYARANADEWQVHRSAPGVGRPMDLAERLAWEISACVRPQPQRTCPLGRCETERDR